MGSTEETTTADTRMGSGYMPPNCQAKKGSKTYWLEVT